MSEILQRLNCKEKEIISRISEAKNKGICDFLNEDDVAELNAYDFINFLKKRRGCDCSDTSEIQCILLRIKNERYIFEF